MSKNESDLVLETDSLFDLGLYRVMREYELTLQGIRSGHVRLGKNLVIALARDIEANQS